MEEVVYIIWIYIHDITLKHGNLEKQTVDAVTGIFSIVLLNLKKKGLLSTRIREKMGEMFIL